MPLRLSATGFIAFITTCLATAASAAGVGMDTAPPDATTGAPANSTAAQFATLDTNHDGYIERAEAGGMPTLARNWQQADVNGDGKLDQAEFAQFAASAANLPPNANTGGSAPGTEGAGSSSMAPGSTVNPATPGHPL